MDAMAANVVERVAKFAGPLVKCESVSDTLTRSTIFTAMQDHIMPELKVVAKRLQGLNELDDAHYRHELQTLMKFRSTIADYEELCNVIINALNVRPQFRISQREIH
jgi:transposase-like protein